MVDKFTKWIKAEPIRSADPKGIIQFVHKNIFTRFGVPHRIITDNGSQFASTTFVEFCDRFGTEVCFASVGHQIANCQVERATG